MKTITKQVKELKDIKAVSKTYTNDKGVNYAYYEYRVYYNDNDYIVMTACFTDDKKQLKELVNCGAIELINK